MKSVLRLVATRHYRQQPADGVTHAQYGPLARLAFSCLDSPIDDIADKAKIGKALSPRFMRRTFQDLGRPAQVHDFAVRAISGHATTTMQEHYDPGSVLTSESGYGGGYANPPSSPPAIPRNEKALVLPGLWSGRRDLNPRRSPWQGRHRPRDFNGLADLEGSKRLERT